MKEIVQDGAQVLRDVAKPVPEEMFGTPELAQIITDMEESLAPFEEGVALAAPQIGIPYRIFVVRKDRTVPPSEDGQPLPAEHMVFINPQIIKTSKRQARMDEGCLSVHGVFGTTERYDRATIRARNPDGSTFERGGGGLMAQIYQHEVDHLNGILFIDHADRLIQVTPHEHEHDDA